MTEDYFKKLRLSYALGTGKQEVQKLFCNQDDIICKRLRNNVRAVRKTEFTICFSTPGQFVKTLLDENIIITNWDAQLIIAGELNSGWTCTGNGYKLHYTKRRKEGIIVKSKESENPTTELVINTILETESSTSHLFWVENVPYLSKFVNGVKITKKAKVRPDLGWE